MFKITPFWFVFIAILIVGCTAKKAIVGTKTIRGIWLTNVASEAMFSDKGLEDAVNKCHQLGITHIFVVTWNNAHTTYPSAIMKALTGSPIDPRMSGRDPLKKLIELAHNKGIEVHAWFEFGFSCSHLKPDGGPIIQAKPNWAARDKDGKIATKNGFQWMNAFNPEVQDFITSLVMEVVTNYDIDGIQGDDRLPALPSLAGYDDYTQALYKKENFGQEPPQNEKDYNWVKWRSAKLTNYLRKLYKTVKTKKPEVLVSMAPSIFPWSEEEYLQDWPQWLNMGIVDFVIPQVYRYQHNRYEYELNKIITEQVSPSNKSKIAPGILLQVDTYNPSVGMLDSMIQTNRNLGLEGEVFFFYEGIKKFENQFKSYYKK